MKKTRYREYVSKALEMRQVGGGSIRSQGVVEGEKSCIRKESRMGKMWKTQRS